LECTCCSESFLRSGHPLASDIVMSMISLDYDDTIMAAAGEQAEACLQDIIRDYRGAYILAVEGNVPLVENGMTCIVGGRSFHEQFDEAMLGLSSSASAASVPACMRWPRCAPSRTLWASPFPRTPTVSAIS
jgi:hydrogenase small subunit